VGKTTTAISLAALFADWNLRVALIDNDPQGNVGVYLGRNIYENERNMADIYTGLSFKKIGVNLTENGLLKQLNINFKHENLTIFLSNHRLSFIGEDFHQIAILTEAMHEIKSEYDLVIIDNGPYIGYLTRAALLAADMILIPTEAGAGGLAGITQIIKEAETINDRHWRKVIIRVFVNNFQYSEHFDASNLKKLKALVGSRLYNTFIPANRHLKKSKELGLPIHLVDKISKSINRGAVAFRILAKNILKDIMPELFVDTLHKQNQKAFNKIPETYEPPSSAAKKLANLGNRDNQQDSANVPSAADQPNADTPPIADSQADAGIQPDVDKQPDADKQPVVDSQPDTDNPILPRGRINVSA
jgi:chromosome partitioning protein